MFKEIEAEIKPTMSLGDIAALVQKTLAVACDEHTVIDLSNLYSTIGADRVFFNRSLIATNSKLLVEADHSAIFPNQEPFLNREIVAISNKVGALEGEKIRKFIRRTFSADGCDQNQPIFGSLSSMDTNLLISNLIGNNENYEVYTSRDDTGLFLEPEIAGSSPMQISTRLKSIRDSMSVAPLKKLSIDILPNELREIENRNHPGIKEFSGTDGRFSYIQMGKFKKGKKTEAEINKIMRGIIKRNPEHIILDLSLSPGGWTTQVSRLLSYFLNRSHHVARTMYRRSRSIRRDKSFKALYPKRLSSHRKFVHQFRRAKRKNGRYTLRVRKRSFGNPSYKGKLTVLVSPYTKSAAIIAAIILKRSRNATIVGFQNSGSTSTSCFAAFGTHSLPLTKIRVHIPDTCYKRSASKNSRGGMLVPDIIVNPLAQRSIDLLTAILDAAVVHVTNQSADKGN